MENEIVPAVPPIPAAADGSAVRHHYPLAVRQASFGTALGLFLKTLPYALARFGILLVVSLVTIVWGIVTLGGAAWTGNKIHPIVGWGWFAVGAGVYGWAWHFVVRYALYLIKCGHVAVLTELVTRGQIGNGSEGMFSYGKRIVTERFAQTNVLFAMDLLVEGVVRAFNRTLDWVGNLLPVPGMQGLLDLRDEETDYAGNNWATRRLCYTRRPSTIWHFHLRQSCHRGLP